MTYRGKEAPIHKAVLAYVRLALPGALIFHPANELNMAGRPEARAIAQGQAKALGMLPGIPDICIFWRREFWGFEVKPEGRNPTDAQTAVGKIIEANGGRWAVVRSVDDAADCIREWRGDLAPVEDALAVIGVEHNHEE